MAGAPPQGDENFLAFSLLFFFAFLASSAKFNGINGLFPPLQRSLERGGGEVGARGSQRS